MFDVGFAELFLLALVGLLVLGPERLPKAARTLGGLVRKARTSWFALRRTIEAELNAAEMSESVKSVGKDIQEIGRELDAVQGKITTGQTTHKPKSNDNTPDREKPVTGE